jgi:hypothetical protein
MVFGIEGDFEKVGYVDIAHARIAAWLAADNDSP